jgi:hypothetical protein
MVLGKLTGTLVARPSAIRSALSLLLLRRLEQSERNQVTLGGDGDKLLPIYAKCDRRRVERVGVESDQVSVVIAAEDQC